MRPGWSSGIGSPGEAPKAASSPTMRRVIWPCAQKFLGQRKHRRQVGGDEGGGTAVVQFVDQLALGIERGEMHDDEARFQGGEEGEGVVGGVGQIEGDFIAGR